MPRIEPVYYEQTTGETRLMFDAVEWKHGKTPNVVKTMAQSPAVLEAYLNFSNALGETLNHKLREQIAQLSAEANGCGYCAAAHTAGGKAAGLTESEIMAAREGFSSNEKSDAALKFARTLIVNRGQADDDDVKELRTAGYTDGEIGEIVAGVALNIFTNYFNETADTEIDFPAIEFPLKRHAASA